LAVAESRFYQFQLYTAHKNAFHSQQLYCGLQKTPAPGAAAPLAFPIPTVQCAIQSGFGYCNVLCYIRWKNTRFDFGWGSKPEAGGSPRHSPDLNRCDCVRIKWGEGESKGAKPERREMRGQGRHELGEAREQEGQNQGKGSAAGGDSLGMGSTPHLRGMRISPRGKIIDASAPEYTGWPKKVSHCQSSSLIVLKNGQRGYTFFYQFRM